VRRRVIAVADEPDERARTGSGADAVIAAGQRQREADAQQTFVAAGLAGGEHAQHRVGHAVGTRPGRAQPGALQQRLAGLEAIGLGQHAGLPVGLGQHRLTHVGQALGRRQLGAEAGLQRRQRLGLQRAGQAQLALRLAQFGLGLLLVQPGGVAGAAALTHRVAVGLGQRHLLARQRHTLPGSQAAHPLLGQRAGRLVAGLAQQRAGQRLLGVAQALIQPGLAVDAQRSLQLCQPFARRSTAVLQLAALRLQAQRPFVAAGRQRLGHMAGRGLALASLDHAGVGLQPGGGLGSGGQPGRRGQLLRLGRGREPPGQQQVQRPQHGQVAPRSAA